MVIKNITMLKNAPGVFFETASNQGLPAQHIKQKGPRSFRFNPFINSAQKNLAYGIIRAFPALTPSGPW